MSERLRQAARELLTQEGLYYRHGDNRSDPLLAVVPRAALRELAGALAATGEPLTEANLFAALDAEGWFRGLSTAEATRYTSQLHARLSGNPVASERPFAAAAFRVALLDILTSTEQWPEDKSLLVLGRQLATDIVDAVMARAATTPEPTP